MLVALTPTIVLITGLELRIDSVLIHDLRTSARSAQEPGWITIRFDPASAAFGQMLLLEIGILRRTKPNIAHLRPLWILLKRP